MTECKTSSVFPCQIAVGFASIEWIQDPSLALPYVREAADAGFVCYVLLVRLMRPNVLAERVVCMVKIIADMVYHCGMKFYLDTDPTHYAEDIVTADPEAVLQCIVPVVCSAERGHFRTLFRLPPSSEQQKLRRISALYCTGRTGVPKREENFTFLHQHCNPLKKRDTGIQIR